MDRGPNSGALIGTFAIDLGRAPMVTSDWKSCFHEQAAIG